MTGQTMLSAVLLRFTDEVPYSQDAAALVALGRGAAVLAERLADYAQSLPASNWMKRLGSVAALPLTMDALIRHAARVPCIVAVSGALADEEIRLAAQITGLGGHCTVVVDATAEIRPEWPSVIRLPLHRSRDAQWAWCMRVYLDAMLNRGLVDLDASGVLACTENRLCELAVARADGHGRALAGVERALNSLAARLDLRACDTFLLLFHSGPDVRPKEIQWGAQACRNALGESVGASYRLKVGHLPATRFAVSLMAGSPTVQDRNR